MHRYLMSKRGREERRKGGREGRGNVNMNNYISTVYMINYMIYKDVTNFLSLSTIHLFTLFTSPCLIFLPLITQLCFHVDRLALTS